jgi:Tfp pilus assembly protein PilX
MLEHEPSPEGFALPAVLLALMLIAALIAGAFSATTEETRMGAAAASRQTALTTAESAIEITIGGLSSSAEDPIGVGETRSHRIEGLDAPVVVYMTRLDSSLYWLVADAGTTSPNSGIVRRIGVVVRTSSGPGHSITIDRISERAWSELF